MNRSQQVNTALNIDREQSTAEAAWQEAIKKTLTDTSIDPLSKSKFSFRGGRIWISCVSCPRVALLKKDKPRGGKRTFL